MQIEIYSDLPVIEMQFARHLAKKSINMIFVYTILAETDMRVTLKFIYRCLHLFSVVIVVMLHHVTLVSSLRGIMNCELFPWTIRTILRLVFIMMYC